MNYFIILTVAGQIQRRVRVSLIKWYEPRHEMKYQATTTSGSITYRDGVLAPPTGSGSQGTSTVVTNNFPALVPVGGSLVWLEGQDAPLFVQESAEAIDALIERTR